MGFNTVAVGTPDDPVLDVIEHILADGRTSRLYRKLVEDERIASSVEPATTPAATPAGSRCSVELLKGKDRKKAEEMVFAELEKLAAEPVSDEELNRARRKILAAVRLRPRERPQPRRRDRPHQHLPRRRGRGEVLRGLPRPRPRGVEGGRPAGGEAVPRPEAGVRRLDRAEGGRRRRRGSAAPDEGGGCSRACRATRSGADAALAHAFARTPAAEPSRSPPRSASCCRTALTLIMLEDHRLPVVVAAAEVRGRAAARAGREGRRRALTGSLLEEGTDKHTGKEIAALSRTPAGASASASSGGSLKVLTPDTDLGLGLLFECLTRPTFPADAFDGRRISNSRRIDDAETQPDTRASDDVRRARLRQAPVRPAGARDAGDRGEADRRRLQGVPQGRVRAEPHDGRGRRRLQDRRDGEEDRGADEGLEEVRCGRSRPSRAAEADRRTEKIVSDPNAAQVHVYIGHLGITRDNPDYYKLLVMDNVLGTGPGSPTGSRRRSATGRAGVHRDARPSRFGRTGTGHVHRVHRHVPRQVPRRPGRVPAGDREDPRRAADQARKSRTPRSTCSAACRSGSRPCRRSPASCSRPSSTGSGSTSWRSTRRKWRR